MELIARKAALAAGLRHYFTGKPCKNGHIEQRQAGDGCCLACAREKAMRYHYADPERAAQKAKRFMEKNPGYVEQHRARINAVSRRYREQNQQRYNEHSARRRAAKRQAVPQWHGELDDLVFSEAFNLAQARTKTTGIKWEVDHAVPLAGRNVCGLHVWNNIQVIPMSMNRRKSNRHAVA